MVLELVNKLPYDHPYRWDGTAVGGVKLWRPDELGADLALWLDAEDTASITLNGSTVSQWDDKSGNARHASQPTSSLQPTYNTTGLNSKPTIDFDGTDDFFSVPEFNTVTVFLVGNQGTITRPQLSGADPNTSKPAWNVNNNNVAYRNDSSGTIRAVFPGGSTTEFAIGGIQLDISGNQVLINGNGGTITTFSETLIAIDGKVNTVGRDFAGAEQFTDGAIAEIITLNNLPSTEDRQRVEGYLAWKWGLESNLPIGHPYQLYPPYIGEPVYDSDAQAYITAVETADGQTLEASVKTAINNFVLGCKADGIWDAIKSSAILAGARTLSGALVPLVGTAPTNFNFVSGDYDRKTGLKGDGATKYLDSNITDDEQGITLNDMHLSVYKTETGSTVGVRYLIGTNDSEIYTNFANLFTQSRGNLITSGVATDNNFIGWSRSTSTGYNYRVNSVTTAQVLASTSVANINIGVFARTTPSIYGTHRLSFYSIGEALDLALLDTRVSNLITAIGAAIP